MSTFDIHRIRCPLTFCFSGNDLFRVCYSDLILLSISDWMLYCRTCCRYIVSYLLNILIRINCYNIKVSWTIYQLLYSSFLWYCWKCSHMTVCDRTLSAISQAAHTLTQESRSAMSHAVVLLTIMRQLRSSHLLPPS